MSRSVELQKNDDLAQNYDLTFMRFRIVSIVRKIQKNESL